jgi:hypothetical protein
VWNEESTAPTMLCANKAHSEPVNCVRWSPCGNYLATCAGDKMVFVLRMGAKFSKPMVLLGETEPNYENWEEHSRFTGHMRDVLHVAWCPKTVGRLASCGIDSNIFVWQLGNREAIKKVQTNFPCKGVAWDPIGKYLAAQVQGAENAVIVWRTRDWKLESKNVKEYESPDETQFLRLSWSPDGSMLATVNAYERNAYTCTVLKRGSGDEAQGDESWDQESSMKGWKWPVTVASFHPKILKKNGELEFCFAVGCQEKKLTLWTTANPCKPLTLIKNMFEGEIFDVTWGGVNSYVLTACSCDGTVALIQLDPEEIGSVAAADEQKKHLASLYPFMADGLADMDLPEDTAQMQFEQLHAPAAPPAHQTFSHTVLTEKVVRANQKETRIGGRRKIAPALTQQVSTVLQPSLEPSGDSSAPAATPIISSVAANSFSAATATSAQIGSGSNPVHLNGALDNAAGRAAGRVCEVGAASAVNGIAAGPGGAGVAASALTTAKGITGSGGALGSAFASSIGSMKMDTVDNAKLSVGGSSSAETVSSGTQGIAGATVAKDAGDTSGSATDNAASGALTKGGGTGGAGLGKRNAVQVCSA